jgi:ketosteroid isomerase-like protein
MSSEASRSAVANVELARALFDELAESGLQAVGGRFDPEVEVHSTPELANPGDFHGISGLMRWAQRWFDAWEEFEIRPELFEPIGAHHVVVSCRQQGRGKGSGVPVEMDATYMLELMGGHVTRFHLYADRDEAIAVAREAEGLSPSS